MYRMFDGPGALKSRRTVNQNRLWIENEQIM